MEVTFFETMLFSFTTAAIFLWDFLSGLVFTLLSVQQGKVLPIIIKYVKIKINILITILSKLPLK